MEILLNELSLSGQFGSIGDFIGRGLDPFLSVISEVNSSANTILKKQNFWQSQVTRSDTIHDIFIGKISRTNDAIRKSKSLLAALIVEPFWENTRKHNTSDIYKYNGNNILDSSLAESFERDKVVISFIHKDFSLTKLSVIKNATTVHIDNLLNSGHYFTIAKNRGLIVLFSLKNTTLFIKTTKIQQGQSVFREISANRYWYLDNFHKTHYEVFDSQGKHIGIANLDGSIDASKKDNTKTITI